MQINVCGFATTSFYSDSLIIPASEPVRELSYYRSFQANYLIVLLAAEFAITKTAQWWNKIFINWE